MDNLTEEEADCANPELLSFLKEWCKGAQGTKAAAVCVLSPGSSDIKVVQLEY